jgi:methylmalonyl-CoA mutase, N-terminal domain
MSSDDPRTVSGFPFEAVYGPEHLEGFDPEEQLGEPGAYPYTRGIYPTMYRGRLWTMRQYAGMSTAEESNRRYKYLLDQGTTGLSVAFDLPTQMGYDSSAEIADGEVGKVGVAIDTVEDMKTLFDGIPLDEVSTSMTINAPASLLLLMYQIAGEEQGVDPGKLRGTIQNDVLKEYIARGTYIYPPAPSLRIIADTFGYCAETLPRFNTISISGYHMGEAGATPVQEIAFTLADGIAYVEAALAAGLDVDTFAPRLSFFFVARSTLLEEVAKFRAARRLWASIMRDRFGATNEKSLMLRFHTQTAGVQLTAQQPEVNMVRVAIQALAATLGGTQSLHTNSYDEALALPTEKSARLALRTQQVIAHESDVPASVDPLAGSYLVESMTDEIEQQARDYIQQIDDMGGAVRAIEEGFQKTEIERAAYDLAKRSTPRSRSSSGSMPTAWTRTSSPSCSASTRRSGRTRSTRSMRSSVSGTREPSTTRSPRWARPPPATTICWCRCARRCAGARRCRRSATCCATSSAATSPPTSSEVPHASWATSA